MGYRRKTRHNQTQKARVVHIVNALQRQEDKLSSLLQIAILFCGQKYWRVKREDSKSTNLVQRNFIASFVSCFFSPIENLPSKHSFLPNISISPISFCVRS